MIAKANLSMKQPDVRLKAVEAVVYALEATPSGVVEAAPPDWLDDVLRGVISALFQIRQQGAYNLANELQDKYFPDGIDKIGDDLTVVSGLKRSGG